MLRASKKSMGTSVSFRQSEFTVDCRLKSAAISLGNQNTVVTTMISWPDLFRALSYFAVISEFGEAASSSQENKSLCLKKRGREAGSERASAALAKTAGQNKAGVQVERNFFPSAGFWS